MRTKFTTVAVLSVFVPVLALLGTAVVTAHGDATGIVKERMDLMKGIGDATKVLTAIFKGEREYDADAVRDAARTIKGRAGAHMTKLFPEGSMHKPTEALQTIWEDWPAFQQYAIDLETYSATLEAAADNEPGPMHGGGRGRGGPMMGGHGQAPMMGNPGNGPMAGGHGWGLGHTMDDPEALKKMPAMASFMRLSQTCNACHTRFRVKK